MPRPLCTFHHLVMNLVPWPIWLKMTIGTSDEQKSYLSLSRSVPKRAECWDIIPRGSLTVFPGIWIGWDGGEWIPPTTTPNTGYQP